ncbi:MAG TPA: translation initiation factor IF-2 N-terminal domain-containing protein, partial [Opitutaceae bacterium]
MSIRIHELAKRHNMDSKDLLALLKERGYVSPDTKSVSSTVSKIYEEEIDKEFAQKAATAEQPGAATAESTAETAAPAAAPQVRLPAGVFVKSKEDVAREREDAVKAKAPAPVVMPPPAPRPV